MMKQLSALSKLFLLVIIAALSSCTKGSETTLVTPTVVTNEVIINANATSATAGGFITSGVSTYTAYGICWSATNTEPTISDSKTTETINLFWFTSSLTGLKANTVYYARAYVTNATGTGYGKTIKFTTGTDLTGTYAQVSTFAGSLAGGFTNATGLSAQFNTPMGIAVDAAGNIYVADSFNSAIRKITPAGVVTTIAGNGTLGYVDGPAATAQFYSPSGVAVDAAGNIYVADRGNNLIRKITAAGVVSTLAGNGNTGYADGTGTAATFNTPTGIAIDAAGNLYVTDNGNNLIRRVTQAGVVTTIAGSRTAGYLDGPSTSAAFNKPTGIAVDATGNIYVTEPLNSAVRKIDADYLVTTLAGGPATTTLVGSATGIAVDAAGNFWITDGAGRIIEINAGKKLTVAAGTSGKTGATDGAGNTALFSGPYGIAADTQGNVYVAESANNLIRKVK